MLALSGETLKVAGLTDISIWCEQFHLDPILRSIHNLFLNLSPHIHPITKQNQLLVYKSFCLFLLATFTLRHPWMKSPIYCQCLQTLFLSHSAPLPCLRQFFLPSKTLHDSLLLIKQNKCYLVFHSKYKIILFRHITQPHPFIFHCGVSGIFLAHTILFLCPSSQYNGSPHLPNVLYH